MLLVAVTEWAAAQAPETPRPRPITVGVMAELTGAGGLYSVDLVRGAQMAVDEVNQQGGVQGRMLKLMVADGGSQPVKSALAMRRLSASDAVAVVGGFGSAQVLANLEVAELTGLAYLVVAATNPAITSARNQWTLRVAPNDNRQADALAEAVVRSLRATRVAVIADSSPYGVGSRDAFHAALARRRVEPLRTLAYEPSDTQFTEQLAIVARSQPQVLAVFGTLPAAALLMREARAMGIQATFVGTGGLSNDGLPAAAQGAAEGLVVTALFDEHADAEAKAWSARYRTRFADANSPPRPQQAAWQYRAIRHLLVPCLERVQPEDRLALRNCLRDWKGTVFGVAGPLAFDATGQLTAPPSLLQVQGQRFVPYRSGVGLGR